MATSYYTENELAEIGFKSYGKNVLMSKKTSIYGDDNITIGNNVRIDDFCVLSGKITLENYIHIAVYSALFGGETGIVMKSFSGLSSRCSIYAESDDYSGETLTNPTVPEKFLKIVRDEVILNKHVILGSGTIVLPGVVIGEGSAVGSMSLVNKSLEEWGVYTGIPCKYRKARSKELLKQEEELLREGHQ